LRLFFPQDGGVLLIPEPIGRMGKGTSGFKQAYPISIGVVPVLGANLLRDSSPTISTSRQQAGEASLILQYLTGPGGAGVTVSEATARARNICVLTGI
jgi:hypothetical protein